MFTHSEGLITMRFMGQYTPLYFATNEYKIPRANPTIWRILVQSVNLEHQKLGLAPYLRPALCEGINVFEKSIYRQMCMQIYIQLKSMVSFIINLKP